MHVLLHVYYHWFPFCVTYSSLLGSQKERGLFFSNLRLWWLSVLRGFYILPRHISKVRFFIVILDLRKWNFWVLSAFWRSVQPTWWVVRYTRGFQQFFRVQLSNWWMVRDDINRTTTSPSRVLFLYARHMNGSLVLHRVSHDLAFHRNLGCWLLSLSKNNLLGGDGSRVIIRPLYITSLARPHCRRCRCWYSWFLCQRMYARSWQAVGNSIPISDRANQRNYTTTTSHVGSSGNLSTRIIV